MALSSEICSINTFPGVNKSLLFYWGVQMVLPLLHLFLNILNNHSQTALSPLDHEVKYVIASWALVYKERNCANSWVENWS